jgi:hypothetical protein
MDKSVYSNEIGKIILNDSNYIASGGEADIWKHDKYAIKIFHSKSKILPSLKVDELSKINHNYWLLHEFYKEIQSFM